MELLSSKLRRDSDTLLFFCPGCRNPHRVRVNAAMSNENGAWGWNGDAERPTFSPSVLCTYNGPDADREREEGRRAPSAICHSYVTAGRINFLSDSTHALAGQTVDLPDLPEIYRDT